MAAFVAAKERFAVHLRPEDVAGALDESADVGALLDQLVAWGNLRADPDTARVRSVEDFNRRRLLYQLTHAGEAAEAAFAAYDEVLGHRGELQAVALADLRVQLAALAELAAQPDPDEAKVDQLLRQLVAGFEGLADNAQAFMASLWRTVDLHEADLEAFLAYKERLLRYLERFVGDLVVASAEIAVRLRALDGGIDRLLALAAHRAARDAAPGQSENLAAEYQEAVEERLARWRDRWAGLRAWFVSDADRPAQERLLRGQARAAVPALLRAVRAHHERRSGRSDRSADFRTLARWFAEAESDGEAHRLWRTAIGVTSARHLTVDQATLDARVLEPVEPSRSWAKAPPVQVSARLRRTGSYERRGKPAQVVDRSDGRAMLAATLAAETAQTAAARTRLATGQPTRLSELGHLDAEEFALFLALLGDVLASGVTRTTTTDGALVVALEPIGDGRVAEIATPGGVLRGPDHILTITDALAPALEPV